MIKCKCGYEGCQQDITPAETQAQFNRNRGLHLRVVHGITGAASTPEGRRLVAKNRYRQKKGLPPLASLESSPVEVEPAADSERKRQQREHRIAYQAEYRKRKQREKYQPSTNNNEAKLKFICPDCGARVFTTPAP